MTITSGTFKYPIVMLIDDNDLDNFINQKIIEGCGFSERVYTNTNGHSALELLKNLALNDQILDTVFPRIIFVDLNMPLIDGFQFIAEFEKFPAAVKKMCKVVILTSSVNPDDETQAKQLKPDVLFLGKPLRADDLKLI